MSVGLKIGTQREQLDPQNEAPTTLGPDDRSIERLIEPFSKPLHPLSDWELAGEQRHIDMRVSLLQQAAEAYNQGERYLARACLKLTYDNILYSADMYLAERDDDDNHSDDDPEHPPIHKVAKWLLMEAIYQVETPSQQQFVPAVMPADDDPEQTIAMQAVA